MWYREDRPARTAYVFPGRGAAAPASTSSVWRVCRRLFARAGLGDAHPHAFGLHFRNLR